jgi:Ran GTPase-activating protein (RanGAP) involved in mRNA processing and transport
MVCLADLPHEVCVRLLSLLPLDSRAACAVLSRALRAAAADPLLWRTLCFDGVRPSRVKPATLRALVGRAGAAGQLLRLDVSALVNKVPRANWEPSVVETALRVLGLTPAAAATLEELITMRPEELAQLRSGADFSAHHGTFLNAAALKAFSACPNLRSFSGDLLTFTMAQGAEALLALPRGCKKLGLCCAVHGDEPPQRSNADECLLFFEALARDTSVLQLTTQGVNFDEASAAALAAALSPNTTLRRLSLGCGSCNGQGGVLFGGLNAAGGCRLRHLGLHGNEVSDEGAVALGSVLSNAGCQLVSLNLPSNWLTCEGAAALAAGLLGNTALKELNLWLNCVGDAGAVALAAALAHDGCALETLNLGAQLRGAAPGVGLGDAAAAALGAALRTNTMLKVLKLERGAVSAAGAAALAAGLHAGGGLRRLSLAHNPLGARGVASLAGPAVAALARLDVSYARCGDDGAAAFAAALAQAASEGAAAAAAAPPRLTHVSFGGNSITAAGAAALAAALRHDTALRILDLRVNALGVDGVAALADALQPPRGNASLEMLIVSDEGVAACQLRSLRGLHRTVAARAVPLQLRVRNAVRFWEAAPGSWTGGEYPPDELDQMRLSLGAMLCHVRRLEQYGP